MGQAETAASQAAPNPVGSGTQSNCGSPAGTVGEVESAEEAKSIRTGRQEARAEGSSRSLKKFWSNSKKREVSPTVLSLAPSALLQAAA